MMVVMADGWWLIVVFVVAVVVVITCALEDMVVSLLRSDTGVNASATDSKCEIP
jgi:hypothetical protein